jgi:protocatechuate 3,4-dioxygenase beta subunit
MCRSGWPCRAALLLAISSLSLPLSAHPPEPPAAQEQPPRDGQRAAPAGTARISGRVVAGDTGRGVSRAHVSVSGEALDKPRSVRTDARGRFDIAELPEGRYTLSAHREPYVYAVWGQKRPHAAGKKIDLGPRQHLEGIELPMLRGGVITGRVVDETGEPVAGISVEAQRSVFADGVRRPRAMRSAGTDDLGQFRLWGLAPGDYLVRAGHEGSYAAYERRDTRDEFAPTYFPSTLDPAAAQRIRVSRGHEVSGVTLALLTSRTVHVSGSIVTSDGRAAPDAHLMVEHSSAGTSMSWGGLVQADGSFELRNMSAGSFTLWASVKVNGRDERAKHVVTVTGEDDVAGLTLVTLPRITIQGQVIFDGTRGTRPPADLSVTALPAAEGQYMSYATARVQEDGTFELQCERGTPLIIVAQSSSRDWTIRSVQHGAADMTDAHVEFRGGDDHSILLVTMTDGVTALSGDVSDNTGRPVSDYTVLVFPEAGSPSARLRWHNSSTPDQAGRYELRGLPPGRYVAAAVEDMEPGAEHDPELHERLRPLGTAFVLGEGEQKVLRLRVAPPE